MEKKNTVVYNSTGKLKRVLLAKPTYYKVMPLSDIARDLHDKGVKPGKERWLKEHEEFESIFSNLDIEINWIEELTPDLPWQASTRDFGVNTPEGVLVGRFRYQERKGEEEIAKESLEEKNERVLAQQITRGCIEGGDCFWLDEDTLIIGNGNRSTYSGYENAKEIMSEYGKRVFVVEFLSKWNHLDVIFSPVADKLAIVCEEAVPGYFIGVLDALGWELIKVPVKHAHENEINMLALGNEKVLSFKGNSLNSKLRSIGLEVFDPDIRTFAAAGEGPHCLSFELERDR